MDAMAGKNAIPEIESIRTPVKGNTFENRVCLFFPKPGEDEANNFISPRSKAAPRLAKWIMQLYSAFSEITFTYSYQVPVSGSNQEGTDDSQEPEATFVNPIELAIADLNTDSFGNEVASDMQLQPLDIFYLSTIVPRGGETEIEKRLKYWIRRKNGLNEDDIIRLKFDKKNDSQLSYLDLVHLSQQVMKLLGSASPLRPKDLMQPDEDSPGTYSEADAISLSDLAEKIHKGLYELAESLADPENKDPQLLIEDLMKASLYGIPLAIPSGSYQEDLCHRANLVISEIDKRRTRYGELIDETAGILLQEEPRYQDVILATEKGIKSLLGDDFIVLSEFTSSDSAQLYEIFNQENLLGDQTADRIRLWLQQAALTRDKVNALESNMILADALSPAGTNNSHFNLMVGQLPYLESNRWLGLAEEERVLFSIDSGHATSLDDGEIPGEITSRLVELKRALSDSVKVLGISAEEWRIIDADSEYVLKVVNNRNGQSNKIDVILRSGALNNVSLVAVCCGEKIFTESNNIISGFKIDGWFETIPDDTVNASVAFHYDAPNTQPPQALLLAVPPNRDKDYWEIEDLVQIVSDTMDLYKIRAVDFEALKAIKGDVLPYPIGAFLPTTVVPVDASKKGWEKLGDTDLITDWLSPKEP